MRFRTALSLLVAAVAPAAVGAQDARLLPGGAEVCLNGVRITAVVVGPAAEGVELHLVVYDPNDGDAPVAAGDPNTIPALDGRHRFELRFESGPFVAGELVGIGISDAPPDPDGSVGEVLELPARDCTLLEEGDFEHDLETAWISTPLVDFVEGNAFDHDHPDVEGTFALLSTHRETTSTCGGDYDANGPTDCDLSSIVSPSFQPFHPCRVRYDVGFYSAEPADGSPQDDYYLYGLLNSGGSAGAGGFSVPGVTGSTLPDDAAFDGVDRTVTGGSGTLGSAFDGGAVGSYTIPYDVTAGDDWQVGFYLLDQADGTGDSGLLIDNVECEPLYIHASGFETSDLIEWTTSLGGP